MTSGVSGKEKSNIYISDGSYVFQIKGKSNLDDEIITCEVKLKYGDAVIYSYSIDRMTPNVIEISRNGVIDE